MIDDVETTVAAALLQTDHLAADARDVVSAALGGPEALDAALAADPRHRGLVVNPGSRR